VPELTAPKLSGTGTVKLPKKVFGERFHNALVYEAVRAEQLARRQGSASTRTKGEARGGGAKPWRQKGTGRARIGSIRAPHWTGGGVAFGPSPRSYTVKINRKARRRALRAALGAHAERGSISILDAAAFDAPSTKKAAQTLGELDAKGNVLVLVADDESACALSFRNIVRVLVLPAREAGVADVVRAHWLVLSEAALEQLAEVAGESSTAASRRAA
jgi:large subunit ribosomal protein L4